MKLFITRSAILTAERQLAQSKRESRENYRRIRSVLRSRLRQPSTLFLAGVGILIGVWFVRRNKAHAAPVSIAASVPLTGLVSTFLIRFGMQRLADTWIRLRAPDPQHSGAAK